MATARKRLTRKQLREPDWFQETVDKFVDYYEGHHAAVFVAAFVLVLLLAAIWGWQIFKQRQNREAGHEFARAMELYAAEKYREAVPAFQKVESYRWSRYASLGYLYEANSYLSMNENNKAVSAAQRFVAATPSDSLYRQIGLLTLASAEERKGRCKQAIEHYAAAEQIRAGFRDRAVLGKARCAEEIGDIQGAVSAYKQYLQDFPDSIMAVRLAELEAKTATPKAQK